MPWNRPDELLVGLTGTVSVAPVGTAAPAGPTTALNSAFFGVGFVTEEGVSKSNGREFNEIRGWQDRNVLRRDPNTQEIVLTLQLMQWNENTVPFALGGGSVVSVSGGYKYVTPGADAALDERALVLDVVDGSEHHRFVYPRGSVTGAVETQFTRTSPAVLPITFSALVPSDGSDIETYLTDATSFAAGS
jgi:hypothetical protein